MTSLRLLLTVACLSPCVACQRHGSPPSVPQARFGAASLAEEDPGASLLAGVYNARLAIAQADRLDAANDVKDASDFASQLAGQSSSLFADAPTLPGDRRPPAGARQAPRMTRFEAQVKLVSASAALANGDLAGADRDLEAVQDAAPPARVPANLPLLRADESLDVALAAAAGERPANRDYQLANAARQLKAYRGSGNAAAVKAMAAEIDAALAQRDASAQLSQARVQLWSDRIDGWI